MNKIYKNINRIKKLMKLSKNNEEEFNEGDFFDELKEYELSEEGDGAAAGGGGGYPTVTKWESGATRGKANPIDSKKKWTSDIKRGKGNTLL